MRDERDPVRSRARVQHGARFQCAGVNPCQSWCTAIGNEHVPVVGYDARRFRKAVQCGEMAASVVINHLDAVSRGMRYKNTPGLWIKGAMVEQRAGSIR